MCKENRLLEELKDTQVGQSRGDGKEEKGRTEPRTRSWQRAGLLLPDKFSGQ